MRILVVHCHPLVDSYSHALFDAVIRTLKGGGHAVTATDLHTEDFQPVMTESERRTYLQNEYDGSAVARYIDTLKQTEGIIFCYPHWWFAAPAQLKGYIDRVWAPGTAFVYDPKDNHLEPNLRHVRLFGVVTSFGSPWWIVRLFAGDPGRKMMMKGLKPLCARDVRSFWLAHYDMDHATPRSRDAFLKKVERCLARY
jgi:NAD(P)H dehydrogenase (quinone)